jgi:hypothetical protein
MSIGHVVILHLGLLGGAVLLVEFDSPLSFLAVLVVLKTILELGLASAERLYPAEPTRWFTFVMRKLGTDPAKEWDRLVETKRRQSEVDEDNEKVLEEF